MNRNKWLWSAVLALLLAVGGALVYANSQAGSSQSKQHPSQGEAKTNTTANAPAETGGCCK